MVCQRRETRAGILPGPTVFKLRSPCKESLGVRIQMSKLFLFERMTFLLFRLSIRLELPEPCRVSCLSLTAPRWHCKALGSLPAAHLQQRPRGPLFQFAAYQLPSPDLGFPASTLYSPNNFLCLEVLFTAHLLSLWTVNRVGPSGPVMLHQLCDLT